MLKMLYFLRKISGGAQPSFIPVVVPREGSYEEFLAAVAARSGVPSEQVRAVARAIGPVLGERTAQGFLTDWPDFALFKPQIVNGSVSSLEASLPAKKRGGISMLARGLFKGFLDNAEVERTTAPATTLEWGAVSAKNGQLTAFTDRTLLKITGKNLDFDDSRADEGVYLVDQATNAALKAVASRHSAQKIDALAPSGLTPGASYTLELHTRGANAAASHELETYVWPGLLTAA